MQVDFIGFVYENHVDDLHCEFMQNCSEIILFCWKMFMQSFVSFGICHELLWNYCAGES